MVFFLAGHLHHRHQAGDIPGEQQDKWQQQRAGKADAGGQRGNAEHAHHHIMRRRLDEGDRTEQHGDVQHHEQKTFAEWNSRWRRMKRARTVYQTAAGMAI